MHEYTEENAAQAFDYGERQLKTALAEFLALKDRRDRFPANYHHAQKAHAAIVGALVAARELLDWYKPR